MAAVNPPRGVVNPLFDFLFGVHAAPDHSPYRGLRLHGLESNDLLEITHPVAQLPFSLYVTDQEHSLEFELRYETHRFARQDVAAFTTCLQDALTAAAAHAETPLSRLWPDCAATERIPGSASPMPRSRRAGLRASDALKAARVSI